MYAWSGYSKMNKGTKLELIAFSEVLAIRMYAGTADPRRGMNLPERKAFPHLCDTNSSQLLIQSVFSIMFCKSHGHIRAFKHFWTLMTVRKVISHVYTQSLTEANVLWDRLQERHSGPLSPPLLLSTLPHPPHAGLTWIHICKSCDWLFDTPELCMAYCFGWPITPACVEYLHFLFVPQLPGERVGGKNSMCGEGNVT